MASVEILNQSPSKLVTTNSEGLFSLNHLEHGEYRIRVAAAGYETWELSLVFDKDTLDMLVQLNTAAANITSQRVRGAVKDGSSGAPIEKALVELLNFSPYKSTYSDENGLFALEGVPVGRQRFRITTNGYEEYIVRDEIVSSGRELVLEVPLTEIISEASTVKDGNTPSTLERRIRIVNSKMLPSNQMAIGGAHPFTIEDVQRFAGCLNDPARTVAASLASTYNSNDSQNHIVARGNSPWGNAWFIEGVPFENPNHFGVMGSTGAPFQVLNTNTLANSDFIISAAPAEYGGAISGIFDLHIRQGNNQRYQFMGTFSLLGGELLAEGPFKKGRSSFLVTYRYSLLHVIQAIGLNITTGSAPQYQDLTFKLNFETKKAGEFSVFGTGGIGDVSVLDADLDPNDVFAEHGQNIYVHTKMGMVGMKHLQFINRNTYIKTTLFGVHQNYQSRRDSIPSAGQFFPYFQSHDVRSNMGISMLFNTKISAKYSIRTGFRSQLHIFDVFDKFLHTDTYNYFCKGLAFENEIYMQNQIKFSDNFVLSVGLHGHHFSINRRMLALEPRVAANWFLGRRHLLSLAYGWHSKAPAYTMLFYMGQNSDGSYDFSNRQLGLMRSHHLNLSYNVQLSHEWRIMTEVYGQYITGVPVEQAASSFSLLNYGGLPIYPERLKTESTGLGVNYGAELTVQKFFSQGYYINAMGSYFRSYYRGSDLQWHNTAFDARYVVQLAAGKEFKIGRRKNNTFNMDIRFHHHGGTPYTPIDVAASAAAGREILDESQPFSARIKPYSRIDFKFGARFNHRKKRISHYFYIDALNVGMFNNQLQTQYNQFYNPNMPAGPDNMPVITSSQFGLVPNLLYQINF